MNFPKELEELGYPRDFDCLEDLLDDGWYEIDKENDKLKVGDFISAYKKYSVFDGTVFTATSNYIGSSPSGVWDSPNYRFYRNINLSGPRKPKRIPLNPYYSAPLPLP